jgi:hypothetical protein
MCFSVLFCSYWLRDDEVEAPSDSGRKPTKEGLELR